MNGTATIIAYTGEEGRFEPVLQRARQKARESGARLILYDIDAASSMASPRPTVWSSDGADEPFERGVLTPEQLEATGQNELAAQVAACREEGIDAYGWLPVNVKVDSLLEYAEQRGADLLVVPAEHGRHSLRDVLRGRTVEQVGDKAPMAVEVVGDDGSVETH